MKDANFIDVFFMVQFTIFRHWFRKMAWRRPGDKPLSQPMMVRSLTHVYVTRPQWVVISLSKISNYTNSEGTSTWVARCCDRSTKMDKFTRPADRGNGWLSVKGISKDQYRRLRGTKPRWGYLGWCAGAHSHCFSRRRWSRASKDQHREPASTAIPGQSWVWPEIYDSCTEGVHAKRTTSGSGNGAPGEGLYQWPSRPGSTHPSPLS